MPLSRIEFEEVRMMFTGSEEYRQRAERIARLTFDFVRELLRRDAQSLAADMDIELLEVAPVNVSFERMNDETIARRGATEIHRALLHALDS